MGHISVVLRLKVVFCDSIPTLPLCANPREIYVYCTLCDPGSCWNTVEGLIDNSGYLGKQRLKMGHLTRLLYDDLDLYLVEKQR